MSAIVSGKGLFVADTCPECSRLLEDHTVYLEQNHELRKVVGSRKVSRVMAKDLCFMDINAKPTRWYGKPWLAPPPDQKCSEALLKEISS